MELLKKYDWLLILAVGVVLFFIASHFDKGREELSIAREFYEGRDYASAKKQAEKVVREFPESKYAKSASEILDNIRWKEKESAGKANINNTGFRGAKWGMAPEEVKAALGAKVNEESEKNGDRFISFDLGEGKKVACWFYDNRFYHATYSPAVKEGSVQAFTEFLARLTGEHGDGSTEITGQTDPTTFMPLFMVKWEDDTSTVTMRMADPEAYAKYQGDVYPSATIMVLYESKVIRKGKEKL